MSKIDAFFVGLLVGVVLTALYAIVTIDWNPSHPHPRDTCPVCIELEAAEAAAKAEVERIKKGAPTDD